MKSAKVRRQTIEKRTREFMDAAQFVTARPLLLWAPQIGKAAKSLMRAVAKHQQRALAWPRCAMDETASKSTRRAAKGTVPAPFRKPAGSGAGSAVS